MNRYVIQIEETLSRDVIIDADNLEEAIDKVRDMYHSEEIVLDASDYVDTNFDAIQSHKIAKGKICPKCGHELCVEEELDYPYQCLYCDENFYNIEVVEN